MIGEILVLDKSKDYTVCVKPSGVNSEDGRLFGMPTLIEQKTGVKPFVVHRLDKDVSGVMVFANNSKTAADLTRQITEKTFKKEYLTVVAGEVDEHGFLEDLLYHDRIKNKTYIVDRERKGVKSAKLEFWRMGIAETENGLVSLVRVKLYTGRTHQIRVQFASRRHPVLGDRRYGSQYNCKIALFSRLIGFESEGKSLEFTAVPDNVFPWNLFQERLGEI